MGLHDVSMLQHKVLTHKFEIIIAVVCLRSVFGSLGK